MMARVESRTTWTVTDDNSAAVTVRIDSGEGEEPTLKIEQGEDHLVWLHAESAPALIRALQGAYDAYTGALSP